MSLTDDIGTGLERARGFYLNLQAAASWRAFSLDSVCEEAYEIAAAEVDRKLAINIFRKFCQIRGRNLVHCRFNWSVSFVYFDQLFYDRGGNTPKRVALGKKLRFFLVRVQVPHLSSPWASAGHRRFCRIAGDWVELIEAVPVPRVHSDPHVGMCIRIDILCCLSDVADCPVDVHR